jgi:hypothetical protein
MPNELTIEAPLDAHALRILADLPSVTAARAPDAQLRFGSRTLGLDVKYKRRITPAEAWQIVKGLEQRRGARHAAVLAIADRTTVSARRILIDHGIGYVDAAGNAHLDFPGIYLHIEKPELRLERRETGASIRLAGRAGVVAQALLLDPGREWRMAELALRAGASIGLVHRVLRRLREIAIIGSQGANRASARVLTNPPALLDLWVEENRDRGVHRQGAYVLPPRSGDIVRVLERRLRQGDFAHALTGTAAAARLAPFVTTEPVPTYWIDADQPLTTVVAALEAEVVESGANVVLMQARDNAPLAFADKHNDVQLANIFRIYHDTRRDPKRGFEQAEHLRREVIGR